MKKSSGRFVTQNGKEVWVPNHMRLGEWEVKGTNPHIAHFRRYLVKRPKGLVVWKYSWNNARKEEQS